MKIMLGADTYPPDVNGAARFTERLGRGLVARGHEVHLVAPSPLGRPYLENRDGVIIHRIKSHRYPLVENFQICFPWQAKPAIAKVLAEVRPDVCHAQAHFVCGRYLLVCGHAQGLPLVATNHFMPENMTDHVKFLKPIEKQASDWSWRDLAKVFSHADVVTAPTPRAVQLLQEGPAKLQDARAISCGIDAQKYRQAASNNTGNDVPVVLSVSRLDQEKRVNELLQAVALLPEDTPCKVEIVGDGVMRQPWEALAQELGIADRVTFHGFVSEEDLVKIYGNCDIFAACGVAELQCLVALEAMSAGKPLLAANAMALPHLCHDGENGFLYQPKDIAQLSRNLAKLIKDPQLRHQMGQASLEIVEGHAIDATLDTFEQLYQEVIAMH